jgi:hypothetical protein
MLFKLVKGKGSVHSFMDAAGVRHFPGDVVELPASYLGKAWLEPVKKEAKPVAAASKVEPVSDSAIPEKSAPAAPLEAKKKRKSVSS